MINECLIFFTQIIHELGLHFFIEMFILLRKKDCKKLSLNLLMHIC